ncbi:MAG: adenylate/guanylate cyclase domain-containing protein [Verrucomicrobia bacterium]|nr:adenylate/guanylate cyclase domain-containing protein [Verrucomicrobiota bacterium]
MPNDLSEQRKLAAIMFTDMVGYSAVTQQNETLALKLLDEHRRLLRPIFDKHNGIEVKTIGDAFLLEFNSALHAVRCAVEMQKVLAEHNASSPEKVKIQIRIGIHVGDVVHRENDVFGDGVNIASRIEPLAEPGGICLTQQVYDQIQNKLETQIVKLGAGELKHIQLPVNIYRVVLSGEKPWSALAKRLFFRLRQRSARNALALIAVFVLLTIVWLFAHQSRTPSAPVQELMRFQGMHDLYPRFWFFRGSFIKLGRADALESTLQLVIENPGEYPIYDLDIRIDEVLEHAKWDGLIFSPTTAKSIPIDSTGNRILPAFIGTNCHFTVLEPKVPIQMELVAPPKEGKSNYVYFVSVSARNGVTKYRYHFVNADGKDHLPNVRQQFYTAYKILRMQQSAGTDGMTIITPKIVEEYHDPKFPTSKDGAIDYGPNLLGFGS